MLANVVDPKSTCKSVQRHRVAVTAAVALLCLSPAIDLVRADPMNDGIGFSPNHIFEGSFAGENVDVMTGNLSLTVPIGPRFVLSDRFGYQLTLYYNSKLWEHDCQAATQVDDPCTGEIVVPDTYGLGFRMSFGRVYQLISADPWKSDKAGVWRYQSPDGAEHFFCEAGSLNCEMRTPSNGDEFGTTVGACTGSDCANITLDGSSVRMEWVSSSPSYWVAYPGDGTKVTFGQHVTGNRSVHGYYATRIESLETDLGNPLWWMNIGYETTVPKERIRQITDSAGRTINFSYSGLLVTISLPAFPNSAPGNRAEYELHLASRTFRDPGDSSQQPTRKFLEEIQYPAGVAETYQFLFDPLLHTDPARRAETFYGYLLQRTLPTGGAVDYFYKQYATSKFAAYHIELVYKEVRLQPTQPPFRWTYTRFGDGVIRSHSEMLNSIAGKSNSSSNAQYVRVLDPFDNLTVYWFDRTNYYNEAGVCFNSACPSSWYDGLLWKTEVYAGPERDSSRLVQKTEYEHTHEGMFRYRGSDLDSPVNAFSAPINCRRISETITTPGVGSHPTKTRKIVYDDWVSPLRVPKAREVHEYDGDVLYRTTYTDYVPGDSDFHDRHNYVEVRSAAGEAFSAVSKRFTLDRLDCEVSRLAGSGTVIDASDTNCSAAVQAGDVRIFRDYRDPNTGAPSQSPRVITVSGGDDGGSSSTTLTYQGGAYLATKKFGALSWYAVDRSIDVLSGLPTESQGPAGEVTTYEWDAIGRLTRIEPEAPESATDITYPTLRETQVKLEADPADPQNYVETKYLYDELGRLTEVLRRNIQGAYDSQKTEYDIAGRMLRKSVWAPEGTADNERKWTFFDYTYGTFIDPMTNQPTPYPDPLGRIHKVTAPDGAVTETAYEGLATIVTTRNIQGSPDASGQPVSLVSTTTYVNDVFGRLVEVVAPRRPDNNLAEGADATYLYDERDNLVEVQLLNNTTIQPRQFVYDRLGRLRRATNPESGAVEYLKYDAKGSLLEYRDARGNDLQNTYDAASRLTARRFDASGNLLPLVGNTYDAGTGKLTQQTSHRVAKTLTVPPPGEPPEETWSSVIVSVRTFSYGPVGTSVPCPVGGASGYSGLNGRLRSQTMKIFPWVTKWPQTDFCQNELGLDTLVAYPERMPSAGRTRTILETRYRNGMVVGLHDLGRNLDYVSNVEYAPGGVVTRIARGTGVSDQIDLDERQRPKEIRVFSPPPTNCIPDGTVGGGGAPPFGTPYCGGTILWDSGIYSYDGAGNVTGIGYDRYYYDTLSRLVAANIEVPTGGYGLSYQYDAFGNMKNQVLNGISTTFNINGSANRLQLRFGGGAPPVSYIYDESGNLLSEASLSGGQGRGFVYDPDGRLEKVTTDDNGTVAKYTYDASGYRVSSVADGAETFYFRDDSGRVLSEFRRRAGPGPDPMWNKDYVYGLGKVLSLVKNDIPAAPARLWATDVTPTSLMLRWQAVEEPDLFGYGIEVWYREHPTTAKLPLTPDGNEVSESTSWVSSYSLPFDGVVPLGVERLTAVSNPMRSLGLVKEGDHRHEEESHEVESTQSPFSLGEVGVEGRIHPAMGPQSTCTAPRGRARQGIRGSHADSRGGPRGPVRACAALAGRPRSLPTRVR